MKKLLIFVIVVVFGLIPSYYYQNDLIDFKFYSIITILSVVFCTLIFMVIGNKNDMKKIFYYIQKFDGIWSVPLGFLVFFFVGILLSSAFGMAVGQYDMAFVQPLFLAGTIVVGATNMAVIGLRFTFRTIYRYIYGKKIDGSVINNSKDDFHNSPPIFKICVSIFLFCFFVVSILWVYLKLV